MLIKYSKLDLRAKTPDLANADDAGFDLRALEDGEIYKEQTKVVGTGLAVEIPRGYAGFVQSKSGLASKGIFVTNSPGLIDAGYRGEIKVILTNLGAADYPYKYKAGDKIAQIVFLPIESPHLKEVDYAELSETERGTGGLGSSGRN